VLRVWPGGARKNAGIHYIFIQKNAVIHYMFMQELLLKMEGMPEFNSLIDKAKTEQLLKELEDKVRTRDANALNAHSSRSLNAHSSR
jgi:hypothetical protein